MLSTYHSDSFRQLAGTLYSTGEMILSGREGIGIGNLHWINDKLVSMDLGQSGADVLALINAGIVNYARGNAYLAARKAYEAAEQLNEMAKDPA